MLIHYKDITCDTVDSQHLALSIWDHQKNTETCPPHVIIPQVHEDLESPSQYIKPNLIIDPKQKDIYPTGKSHLRWSSTWLHAYFRGVSSCFISSSCALQVGICQVEVTKASQRDLIKNGITRINPLWSRVFLARTIWQMCCTYLASPPAIPIFWIVLAMPPKKHGTKQHSNSIPWEDTWIIKYYINM